MVSCVATAGAQTTYIVDYFQRGGHHFADLPPALAVVQDGDTILLRGGWYTGGTLSKVIKFHGMPNEPAFVTTPLIVANIPAGKRLVMKSISGAYLTRPLELRSCDGQLLLETCDWPEVVITDCKDVLFNLSFMSTLTMNRSRAVLSDCRIAAPSNQTYACNITSSRLVLAGGGVAGMQGWVDPIQCRLITNPGPAMQAMDSEITMGGIGYIVGGSASGGGSCSIRVEAPAVVATNVTIYHDGTGRLGICTGSYAINPSRHVAALSTLGVSPGYRMDFASTSKPGYTVYAFASLPSFPLSIPLGDLYLDISTTVMIDVGTMDQNGGRRFSIPIGREFPPDIPLMFQVAAMTPGGLALGAPTGVLMRNYSN
jgi:hypothetical protein